MNFTSSKIQINAQASQNIVLSSPILIPDGAKNITCQFFFELDASSAEAATVQAYQSTDGINFDPVLDGAANPLAVTLNPENNSATINILGLLSLWLQFKISFSDQTSGIITSCNMLFS
jgi:hypothetical protein